MQELDLVGRSSRGAEHDDGGESTGRRRVRDAGRDVFDLGGPEAGRAEAASQNLRLEERIKVSDQGLHRSARAQSPAWF